MRNFQIKDCSAKILVLMLTMQHHRDYLEKVLILQHLQVLLAKTNLFHQMNLHKNNPSNNKATNKRVFRVHKNLKILAWSLTVKALAILINSDRKSKTKLIRIETHLFKKLKKLMKCQKKTLS